MSPTREKNSKLTAAVAWLTAGLALLVLAWMVPVNLKSVTPALLRAAGENTPRVAAFGQQRLDSEKLGAASLILEAARLVNDPGAASLERGIRNIEARRPEWVPWGGWDPFLDPIFSLKENTGRTESTPVLTFFITEKARRELQRYLSNSRSIGVQTILQTHDNQGTTRFVPANRPGGEALDAVILLTALLYQSDNLSPALQRELRTLAETAAVEKQLGPLETFYLDLLSLGKRLNWMQLCELLRVSGSTRTVGEFAQLARVASDNLFLIYTAALYSGSADNVADYLMEYGRQGLADLRLALGEGQGAVRLLLRNRAPVNHSATLNISAVAEFTLLNPRVALAVKYAAFFVGAFLLFHALEVFLGGAMRAPSGDSRASPLRLRSFVLAGMIALFLVFASEPFLIKTPPPSEFKFKLVVPVLAADKPDSPITEVPVTTAMDTTTILSILLFAALQIAVYVICLLKIRYISRQPISPQLKLRLMDNEENLFDAGLYVGIAGTATALVLQVLGYIQANLLAAYSSNLFGILCVAIVKIRHVRHFKRQLILQVHGSGDATPQPEDATIKPATTNP
ncbi:hypothetical protein [Ereboglobus luteus]|uniref:Uncharacterized protein n=1 Tax=Ereboglobus luteus TaxID=1796921 RepID=A0A2U8E384_9BACT|nr:hypothetical protein [Ereboglobus luteus]AWI09245.1 hypothetical protein CKA38_08330 [Ereboglobus luteus]